MDISRISREEIAEICREYTRAMDPKKQIQISSELHLKSKDTIRAVLESQGYLPPKEKKHVKTVTITHDGKTLTLNQWAKEIGISQATLRARYYKGWDAQAIITTPVIKGETNHA